MNMNLVTLLQESDVQMRPYSGRGMFGKICLAIVGETHDLENVLTDILIEAVDQVYAHAIDAEDDEAELKMAFDTKMAAHDIIHKIRETKKDTMGVESVFYWPNIKWENQTNETEDEE